MGFQVSYLGLEFRLPVFKNFVHRLGLCFRQTSLIITMGLNSQEHEMQHLLCMMG